MLPRCQATGIFDPLTSLKLTPSPGQLDCAVTLRRFPAYVRRSAPSLLLKRGRAQATSEALRSCSPQPSLPGGARSSTGPAGEST